MAIGSKDVSVVVAALIVKMLRALKSSNVAAEAMTKLRHVVLDVPVTTMMRTIAEAAVAAEAYVEVATQSMTMIMIGTVVNGHMGR